MFPHSPSLPWAIPPPLRPRSSKWDPRESLLRRWVQPCPLSPSLFPREKLPTHSIPQEPLTYGTIQNQYLTELSPMAPTAPGELGGLQPPNPGGVDTPLTNPSWIFQAGGHRLHSPGHRAPWRASRPHLPVASAPTTTPPACGASMTPRLDHPPKKVLPHPRNPILGFSQIAVGGIKTLCNVIGLPPHFGGFLHPKGWQEGFGWSGVVTWPAAAGGLYESGFQVFPASFGMTQLICGREIRAGL